MYCMHALHCALHAETYNACHCTAAIKGGLASRNTSTTQVHDSYSDKLGSYPFSPLASLDTIRGMLSRRALAHRLHQIWGFAFLTTLAQHELQLLRITILNLTWTPRQTKHAKSCCASPKAKFVAFVDLTCTRWQIKQNGGICPPQHTPDATTPGLRSP